MNFRPKTVRRLLFLFAAVAVMAGILVAWLTVSERRIAARIAGIRKDAIASYNAHDYAGAAKLFGEYLTRGHNQDSDAEALFDYANSLANVPEAGRHRYESVRLLEHYLTIQPDDPYDARHLLLKLYAQAQFNKEARGLADRLLALNPADLQALSSRAQALEADGNNTEALAAYRRLNQLAPHNLTWQIQELDLMSKTRQPPQQIVQHANELAQRNPQDPVALALVSVANLLYAHDDAVARKAIQAAAGTTCDDPETVLQIVRLLDVQQEFRLADDMLGRAGMRFPQAPRITCQIVERTWQRRLPSDVLGRLEKLDPATGDPALLGYKAMALYESGRAAETKPLLHALGARKDDVSVAWTMALQTACVDRPSPAVAIHKYAEASLRDPANPVFYSMLGQCYQSIGETDQAIRQWTKAGRLSPCWALPYCLISRSLSATGRYSEALGAAEIARLRLPGAQLVETSYAWAWYGLDELSNSRHPDAAEKDALFSLLDNIQKAWKNEPITLPFYVTMLGRRGERDAAIRVVRQALDQQPLPPAQTLLQLASVSRQEKLDLGEQILDRASNAYPNVPSVAFARAMELIRAGKPRDATQSFDQAERGHENDLSWQVTRAQLSDAVNNPDAVKRWATLADANPKNLTVQYALLLSPARLQDRAMWRRAIDRVKSIMGPDGQLGRIEEARWSLAAQPSAKELAGVVSSLQKIVTSSPNLPEPHRLLAEALLRQGTADSVAKAMTELTAAHELQTADLETTVRLAEMLASRSLRDQAAGLVDEVAHHNPLSTDQRLWAADLYAKLGHVETGIKLLTDAQSSQGADDAARQALLAQLYRRSGRSRDAQAIYLKLLNVPDVSADTLAAGAEFFAGLKQSDVAGRFVEKLVRLPLKTSSLALLRAHLDQTAGQPEQALRRLTAVVKENPGEQQLWQELSGAWLRAGNFQAADKAAEDGLAANPQSSTLAAMRLQIARLRNVSARDVGPLLEVICHDPQQPVVDQAMRLLADGKARNDPDDRVLSALRQLADQNGEFVPLQELLVQRYAAAGRLKDAADIASRASAAAPDDPEPLRLLCAVETAAGHWDVVRQTAQRWRQLLGDDAINADIAIARSDLRQAKPDPDAAISQIAPYLSDSASQADRQAAMPLYCSALIAAGRAADAAAMLEPSLAQSRQSRLLWLELAAAPHKDAGAACDWLKKIGPLIGDSPEEKLALADAWERVGARYDSRDAHEAARDVLQPIIDGIDNSSFIIHHSSLLPQAWSSWAAVNQSLENLPQAEHGWREYLKQRPSEPLAKNNLAYMLMLDGNADHLAEAEQLSRSAIDSSPTVSTLYDTLARIQLRLGKTEEAVRNFRAALDRNPDNLEAMIGLADVLQSRPRDREEVRSLLARIDGAIRGGAPLPTSLRKQLDRVKTALSSSL